LSLCDIFPPNAPGMPPVGLDFIEAAQIRGDKISKRQGEGKATKIIVGPQLEDLIRSALYDRGNLNISITVKGAKKRPMPIIPGHLWTDDSRIPSQGPAKADVMIIGKQLGDSEVQCSRCLVGATGELLYDTLRKYGVDPDEINTWYVTSILKTGNPEGGDSWRQEWVKNFLHLLHQELRIVQPKYILCLGADSVKTLLGKTMTLSKIEGRVVEYSYDIRRSYTEPERLHTALVMGCTHPAYVLSTPEMEDKFELAVAQFVQITKGNRWDMPETDTDHRVIDNEDDLKKLVAEVKAIGPNNIIAMDCEWHGEHPQNKGAYMRCIQVSWAHKAAACIVLNAAGGKPAFKHKVNGKLTTKNGHKTVVKLLYELLEDNRLCGHFLNADLEWLVPLGLDIRHKWAPAENFWDCKDEGGLDTALMAHALDEVGDYSLTGQTLRYTSAPRYDLGIGEWKERYCKENGIKVSQLEGYGECPDEVLYPYALYDADVTRRIALVHMKNLSRDCFDNNCWEAFWVSQRAALAVLEIKCTGIPIDHKRVDELTSIYMKARDDLYAKIRQWFKWPELNLQSTNHVRELLFGEELNGKRTPDGKPQRLRPEGAVSLYAVPVLTTEKRSRPWENLTAEEQKENIPATNKSVLGMMFHSAEELAVYRNGRVVKVDHRDQIGWIRDYRYISQILKSVLRPPLVDDSNQIIVDEDDNWEYDAGLPGVVCDDGRVRTTIYQTKETGRWSSARPPLQNLSKRREPDYKRILGDKYKWPLRSVLTSPPGYTMVEADYIGAELFGMAIMAGDDAMIDHASRNQLPEDHPDFYDIHSNVAVLAFGYDCPPTKAGLAAIGKSHMRVVAKAVIFGIAYGRQAKAIALAAKEDGVDVSQNDAQRIIDAIFEMYPGLTPFFEECRHRAVSMSDYGEAPQWLCGPFGRFRRFKKTRDRKSKGDMERQAQNFPIQGMIADAVSLAIAKLYDYRFERYAEGETVDDLDYQICLQVHDAILCFVRNEHVSRFIDEVLPACMVKGVPIYPCGLDGSGEGFEDKGPYYLGIDTEVYTHWGVVPLPSQLDALGIDPKYAHWRKGSGLINGQTVEGLVQKEAYPRQLWYKGALHKVEAAPKKTERT
jgi:uracil-DNA glycosylase family 4